MRKYLVTLIVLALPIQSMAGWHVTKTLGGKEVAFFSGSNFGGYTAEMNQYGSIVLHSVVRDACNTMKNNRLAIYNGYEMVVETKTFQYNSECRIIINPVKFEDFMYIRGQLKRASEIMVALAGMKGKIDSSGYTEAMQIIKFKKS